MVFEQIFATLGSQAIFAVYLPFLLMFALFFAVLTKTNIFGKKETPNTRVNILLSIIFSLYIVAFSPVSGTLATWIASLFAATGVTLVSIMVFFLVIGLMVSPWWDKVLEAGSWKWLIPLGAIFAFLIVLGSTFSGVGIGPVTIPGLSSQDLVFLMLVIITIIIIFWMTSKAKDVTPGQWFLKPG